MKNSSKNLPKPLVVGFVLDDRLDKPDGVQQYVKTMGEWLTQQGHEVHYLVGNSPSLHNRSDVHHLGKTIEVRFNKNRMGVPLPAKKSDIRSLLKSYKFDVLHVQVPYSPQLAARVIMAAPKSVVVVGTFHILPFSKKEQLGTRLLAAVLRRSRKRFDHMFSVSSEAAIFAKKYFKTESSVLPNVIDLKKFKVIKNETIPKQRRKIVFLGRLVPRKGALELLRAYHTLLSEFPEFIKTTELIIGGKGPQLQALQEQQNRVLESFPDARITFSGFISEEDKPRFLSDADVLAFPATGGESFGIVLLEGMAAGAGAVLAGDNPGYRSVLGSIPDSIVNSKDAISFAHQIHKILTDKQFAKELHQQQQKLVINFDVDKVGRELVQQYRTLAFKKQKTDNNGNV